MSMLSGLKIMPLKFSKTQSQCLSLYWLGLMLMSPKLWCLICIPRETFVSSLCLSGRVKEMWGVGTSGETVELSSNWNNLLSLLTPWQHGVAVLWRWVLGTGRYKQSPHKSLAATIFVYDGLWITQCCCLHRCPTSEWCFRVIFQAWRSCPDNRVFQALFPSLFPSRWWASRECGWERW